MDAQGLLDQILKSGQQLAEQGLAQGSDLAAQGKALAEQGLDYAEDKLNFPEAGPERDKLLKNLGIGAAAGGLLALLVGTKTGRRALGPALKLGSLAALGGVGYKVYSEWQKSQGQQPVGESLANLAAPEANVRSLSIVRAMIAAAKADGNIDDQEREIIGAQIKESGLEDSAASILIEELQKPLDVAVVAAEATSPAAAVEIYLASLLVTDQANGAEQIYLTNLASALKLETELVQRLETEAFAAS